MTDLSFKSGVTVIGDSAFQGCTGLKSVTLPSSVVSIGTSAFSGCTALAEVSIPKATMSIKSAAFSGCTFTTVTINKVCSYQSDSFPTGIKIENY